MEAATALRPCARCDRDLTDAASIESGFGPSCRGKANAILAMELPAAFDGERLVQALSLTTESFPAEVHGLLGAMQKALFASRAFAANEGGEDHRGLVRRLAYLSSWTREKGTRTALLDAIRGLGFEGYASYLAGEASPAAGMLRIEGGRLYLKATRNGYALEALRKLKSCAFTAGEWSVALVEAEALLAVTRRFWPLTECAAVAARLEEMRRPVAHVWTVGEGWLAVETPKRVEEVRAALVALPSRDRWWDGQVGAWKVRAEHRATVEAALSPFFRLAA